MKKLLFNWGVSDHFGWGIYGLNLLEWGAKNPHFQLIPLEWPPNLLYPINELRISRLKKLVDAIPSGLTLSNQDITLIYAGNHVSKPSLPGPTKEVAVTFFESNPLPDAEIKKLRSFDHVFSGSTWNSQKLEEMRIANKFSIQGVDTDLFRPQDKRLFKDRFVVFSGGKLEFRKGQDIVLAAFSIFSKKFPDALLVNCWRSPWEDSISSSINHSTICEPFIASSDMSLSLSNWIRRNGVNDDQFICLGPTPNSLLPEIFREVDLAIFTNRCEGGTNLVAMEAMSSGIPCAISKNTGHLDLIKQNNCIPLNQQGIVKELVDINTVDWGESNIDELVGVMELAYQGQLKLDRDNIRSSMIMNTWENSIDRLLKYAEDL